MYENAWCASGRVDHADHILPWLLRGFHDATGIPQHDRTEQGKGVLMVNTIDWGSQSTVSENLADTSGLQGADLS